MTGVCFYCGQESGHIERDHVEPLSRGGKDVPENILLACRSCNRSKGPRFLLEWVASGRSPFWLGASPQILGPTQGFVGVRRGNLHEPLLERERAGVKPVDIIRRDLLRFWATADDSVRRLELSERDLKKLGAIVSGVAFDEPRHASNLWAYVLTQLGEEHPLVARLKGQPLAVLYGVIDAADRAHHRSREKSDG